MVKKNDKKQRTKLLKTKIKNGKQKINKLKILIKTIVVNN